MQPSKTEEDRKAARSVLKGRKKSSHEGTARLEDASKPSWRGKGRKMWRGHCSCGWKGSQQRARRGPAFREAEKHANAARAEEKAK